MDPITLSLTPLAPTPQHEYIISRLLNGIVGTEAQRAAVIRIVQQLRKEMEEEYHARTALCSRSNEPIPYDRLEDELNDTRVTLQIMTNHRAKHKNTSIDPVDSYVPTTT